MKPLVPFSKFLTLFLFSLFSTAAFAQVSISGRVTDAIDSSALIGVTIREKGTSNGTSSDIEGNFRLSVNDPNAVLVFQYTGYLELDVPLQGRTSIQVTMGTNVNLIDEVVVIGYGVQQKSDLTGSVSTLKSKDIEKIPTSSLEQAMQGKIAGVYVTPSSGQPGAGAIIRIRGTGTLNNANPLYVVDGMLLDNISFINPQDVASIEVLKDASATAIYGNRGANGVIIITTKKGSADGKAVVSLSTYYGTQEVTRRIPMANASEFAQMYNELTNDNYFPDPASLGAGFDWQDYFFQNAPIGSVQLSANGGNNKHLYNVSANYFNQEGIIKESSFERITLRLNNEYEVNRFFRLGNNIAFARSEAQNPSNSVEGAYRMQPVLEPLDSTGKFTDPTMPYGTAMGNAAADLFYRKNNHTYVNRMVGTIYGDIKLFKHFTFRSNFGLDLSYLKNKFYLPEYEVSISQRNPEDQLNLGYDEQRTWLWENTLTYAQEWENLRLNVLGGYTSQESYSESYGAGRRSFPSGADELLFLSAGNDTTMTNYGGASDWAMVSYLFRVNTTLFDRYLFTASMRADGSSRFNEDNRWGYFPSLAVGWNVVQESFMENQRIFDRLKLRASWGISGNDKTQLYPSLGAISNGLSVILGPGESLNNGATLINYANSDVRWEEVTQADIGLEMAFLNNRLSTEIDFYNRYTKGILADLPIPAYVGSQSNPVVNQAEVVNRGIDFTMNWRESKPRFSYNLGVIISTVHNEVKQLSLGRSEIFSGATGQGDQATRTVVGEPIASFYGFVVDGIFQNAEELASLPRLGNEGVGDFRYKDLNGDGVINGEDRQTLGSPIPNLTYGFNGGVEFMGIDFSADFFGVTGNEIVNVKAMSRFAVYNWEKIYVDGRWTGEGTSTSVPKASNGGANYRMSDFYVEDGSFIRLRSIVLGYTLPVSWTEKAGMSRLRLYTSGTNLWTKQKYQGYSPEFSSNSVFNSGLDTGIYPIFKTILVGLDVTF